MVAFLPGDDQLRRAESRTGVSLTNVVTSIVEGCAQLALAGTSCGRECIGKDDVLSTAVVGVSGGAERGRDAHWAWTMPACFAALAFSLLAR